MTYSIAAVDRGSGAAGVASITAGMAVGAFVPYARAGAGAIATQGASTNWLYGERGLVQLGSGADAKRTLEQLIDADDGRDYRQCIIVDRQGRAAAWTGKQCGRERTHATRSGVAAAGNILADAAVVSNMVDVYSSSAELGMPDRLLAALVAGEAAGGDTRGIISAVLIVDFQDRPPIDIRVDYAPGEALDALKELYRRYTDSPFREFYDSVPTRTDFSRRRR